MKNKHWMVGTRFYRIWGNIKTRCNNPKHERYHRYWWRWITYCGRWNNFEWFYSEMYESYQAHFKENDWDTTIEREDNDLPYNKANCKWITMNEQWLNKHNTIYYKNIPLIIWCKKLNINTQTVRTRINRWKNIKEALGL